MIYEQWNKYKERERASTYVFGRARGHDKKRNCGIVMKYLHQTVIAIESKFIVSLYDVCHREKTTNCSCSPFTCFMYVFT